MLMALSEDWIAKDILIQRFPLGVVQWNMEPGTHMISRWEGIFVLWEHFWCNLSEEMIWKSGQVETWPTWLEATPLQQSRETESTPLTLLKALWQSTTTWDYLSDSPRSMFQCNPPRGSLGTRPFLRRQQELHLRWIHCASLICKHNII